MGTNYYHRTNICPHCDRHDKHHIGKSSGGWTFSFHGEKENPEWNSLKGVVASFTDWKERLKEGKIFDEYGKEVSLEDFLQLVEAKRDEKNNHTTYCKIHHAQHAVKGCWLDDEGNSFSDGAFS